MYVVGYYVRYRRAGLLKNLPSYISSSSSILASLGKLDWKVQKTLILVVQLSVLQGITVSMSGTPYHPAFRLVWVMGGPVGDTVVVDLLDECRS
jgi:hypothetical protein